MSLREADSPMSNARALRLWRASAAESIQYIHSIKARPVCRVRIRIVVTAGPPLDSFFRMMNDSGARSRSTFAFRGIQPERCILRTNAFMRLVISRVCAQSRSCVRVVVQRVWAKRMALTFDYGDEHMLSFM